MYYLDRDTFWTLYLADEALGGIGAGMDEKYEEFSSESCRTPHCSVGIFIDNPFFAYRIKLYNKKGYLVNYVSRSKNDNAVINIYYKKSIKITGYPEISQSEHVSKLPKVSFKEWCKELKICSSNFIVLPEQEN